MQGNLAMVAAGDLSRGTAALLALTHSHSWPDISLPTENEFSFVHLYGCHFSSPLFSPLLYGWPPSILLLDRIELPHRKLSLMLLAHRSVTVNLGTTRVCHGSSF